MALFNYATRELSAKIVYYGPGLSGKTTNIEMVHRMLRPEQKGRLISLPTETDRTLFFDFLPLELGEIKGFKVRFHLYTVPGQVFYNATRRLVLQGVDGVVFVADSQVGMMGNNVESLRNLEENLATYGKKLVELPFVIQYNKRDLKNIASVDELDRMLNARKVPVFEGVAKDGVGVTETLVVISRLVFNGLRRTLLLPGETAESDELGELADTTIGDKFRVPEEAQGVAVGAEPPEVLEELWDFEELGEAPDAGDEVELELGDPVPAEPAVEEPPVRGAADDAAPGDLERPEVFAAEPAPGAGGEEAFEEIDIDLPEPPPAAAQEERPGVPAEPEAWGEPAEASAAEPAPGAGGEEAFEEIDIDLPEPPPAAAQEEPPPIPADAEAWVERAEASAAGPAPGAGGEEALEEIDIDLPEPRSVAAQEEPPPIPADAEAWAEPAETSLAQPAPGAAEEEAFEEIDIDLAEPPPAAERERPRPAVPVDAGAPDGLTFLKFEGAFVSPEGHAVLPAVFIDRSGSPVRIRIRISVEGPGE